MRKIVPLPTSEVTTIWPFIFLIMHRRGSTVDRRCRLRIDRCDPGLPSPNPRLPAHGRRTAGPSSCCSWELSCWAPYSRNCAQILAQDLADVRLRQCFEEANLSGHLVRRKFAATVRDHLGFGQTDAARLRHAVYANIQAPYPTTWSREPAVSPELHNESRRIFRPRRPVSSSRPATAWLPQA